MDKRSYEEFLLKHGFTLIGAGNFSNVYAKPGSDRCVKVGRAIDSEQWPEYIKWATEHGFAGSFAPLVYSFKNYGAFYVASMERLVCTISELPSNTDQWEWWIDPPEELASFLQLLGEANLDGDIYDRNIMLRKDGQLVYTDPAYGSGHSDKKYRIKQTRIEQ